MGLLEKFKKLIGMREEKIPIGSFDIIGSREKAVAIVEIPKELENEKVEIAKGIMNLHKNVKSVLEKVSGRKGIYRTRELRLILGDRNTEVIHKEYGCLFMLDPRKVYFSPREATERQRVASQVKENERVMVMFSGVMPYGIVIAKVQPRVKEVFGVEINPVAHEYALENVRLNKLKGKVFPILGDVREKCKEFYGTCDRVVMPLPLGAHHFLDIAIKCLKPEGGVIHFYNWGEEGKLYEEALKIIDEVCKKIGKKYKILNKRKVLPFAPRKYKICVEFKVYS